MLYDYTRFLQMGENKSRVKPELSVWIQHNHMKTSFITLSTKI